MTERLARQRLRSPRDRRLRASPGGPVGPLARWSRRASAERRGRDDDVAPHETNSLRQCPHPIRTARSVSGTLFSITNLRLRPLNIPVTPAASGGLAGALTMLG